MGIAPPPYPRNQRLPMLLAVCQSPLDSWGMLSSGNQEPVRDNPTYERMFCCRLPVSPWKPTGAPRFVTYTHLPLWPFPRSSGGTSLRFLSGGLRAIDPKLRTRSLGVWWYTRASKMGSCPFAVPAKPSQKGYLAKDGRPIRRVKVGIGTPQRFCSFKESSRGYLEEHTPILRGGF